MTKKDLIEKVFTQLGKSLALEIQNGASEMTNTEIVANDDLLPEFDPSKQYLNKQPGYICRAADGNVWRLLQVYDSTIYTQQPSELPAQWAPVWTKDPKDAKPFVAMSTAPYMKDECCKVGRSVYKSLINNNVWAPTDYPQGWELVVGVTSY